MKRYFGHLQLADRLGVPLYRLLPISVEMTHREFLTWRAYLDNDWNRPSRSDHYLMRVAQRVHQTVAKEPNKVTMEMQRVEFKPAEPVTPPVVYKTPEEAAEAAKRGKWAWLMGMARNCPPEYKEPLVPQSEQPRPEEVDPDHVVEQRERAREGVATQVRSMWDTGRR